MAGDEPTQGSANQVTEPAPEFRQWVEANAQRIEKARYNNTVPYFIASNGERIFKGLPITAGERFNVCAQLSRAGLKTAMADTITRSGGGYVVVSHLVNPASSDYSKLLESAAGLIRHYEGIAFLPPHTSRSNTFDYRDFFADLIGTPYEGKCPDIKLIGKEGKGTWYEHEGFITTNPKNAFRNMLNDGLKQSNRIIIERPNLTERYMLRSILNRVNRGDQDIMEIWIKEANGSLTLFYKKTDG